MPGVDLTDFFNYGFTPDTWKAYCAQVARFRVEFSMQKKIATFGGVPGGGHPGVDMDLPPELRAAVAASRMGGGPPPGAGFMVRRKMVARACAENGVRPLPRFFHDAPFFPFFRPCLAVHRRPCMVLRVSSKVSGAEMMDKWRDSV